MNLKSIFKSVKLTALVVGVLVLLLSASTPAFAADFVTRPSDNPEILKAQACIPPQVNIEGPTHGVNFTVYTWTAQLAGFIFPGYVIQWNYGYSPGSYPYSLGTGYSVSRILPRNRNLYLKVTVIFPSTNDMLIDYHTVINLSDDIIKGEPIAFPGDVQPIK